MSVGLSPLSTRSFGWRRISGAPSLLYPHAPMQSGFRALALMGGARLPAARLGTGTLVGRRSVSSLVTGGFRQAPTALAAAHNANPWASSFVAPQQALIESDGQQQQQQQQRQRNNRNTYFGLGSFLGKCLLVGGSRTFCLSAEESDYNFEDEEEGNIAPWAAEHESRLKKDLLPEDFVDRIETSLYEDRKNGLYYKAVKKHLDAHPLPEESKTWKIVTSFPPTDEPISIPEPEKPEEPEPVDQDEIERFLKRIGEDDNTDKFPNWNALMTYNSRKLKTLEVSMKSRKNIRKHVELFKQSMVLRGYSPIHPPWEMVTLEEAREIAFQENVRLATARAHARRDLRIAQAESLERRTQWNLEQVFNLEEIDSQPPKLPRMRSLNEDGEEETDFSDHDIHSEEPALASPARGRDEDEEVFEPSLASEEEVPAQSPSASA